LRRPPRPPLAPGAHCAPTTLTASLAQLTQPALTASLSLTASLAPLAPGTHCAPATPTASLAPLAQPAPTASPSLTATLAPLTQPAPRKTAEKSHFRAAPAIILAAIDKCAIFTTSPFRFWHKAWARKPVFAALQALFLA
jgi:hypothetical protein